MTDKEFAELQTRYQNAEAAFHNRSRLRVAREQFEAFINAVGDKIDSARFDVRIEMTPALLRGQTVTLSDLSANELTAIHRAIVDAHSRSVARCESITVPKVAE